MADFNTAYKVIAQNEGGWNVDNGGQTYKGIARNWQAKWEGWKLIDQWIRANGAPRKGMFFTGSTGIAIDRMVADFYRKKYWNRIYGDYIKNQTIANFILDFLVNSNGAMLPINAGLGARISDGVNEDSLKIINERPAFAYQVIYNVRKKYYTKLVANPKMKKYAKGWFARLDSFPKQISTFSFDPYSFNA